MRNWISRLIVSSALVFIGSAGLAHAGLILQAVDVTATNSNGTAVAGNMIDQSSLSAGYTSQVTDFDAYVTSTTHDFSCGYGCWASVPGTGYPMELTFSLGGLYAIQSLGLWSFGFDAGVNAFDLYAADNAGFVDEILLGSFNATNITTEASNVGQVFSFASTEASFVKMVINSNFGHPQAVVGEIAFELSDDVQVAEPAGLGLLGLGLLGLAATRKRRT
ncbi:PEP-CTERM sorting domain-containing protein [Emcibacter nanhaiensis]|uniref:PEP-CTERM sorting domain-containing protein n=1 Tax=Emcibacter nanhaiensis TaxID=1505037 RepID=A0A501PFG8_9PROT|nr:PEP-CTERM sorting domain-containing protein [Emcibacter nanhaiensis]TPD59163.1 PEP-CTERM sorting domain-containing protein [Emcibacter nanhaiensis]